MWYLHNQLWMQSSKEGTEASRSRNFNDGQEWGRKCFEDLDQKRIGRPATRTTSTDCFLREGSSQEEMGKLMKNKSIPWQLQKRLLQMTTGTFPCGQQMQKYGYRRTATCVVSEGARGALKQLERRAAEGDNWPRVRDDLDNNGRWSPAPAMRASGSCYKKSVCPGKRIGT